MNKFRILAAALVAGTLASCSDDDTKTTTDPTVSEVFDTMSVGQWKVINFVDEGNDETTNFQGFIFRFNKNTGAATAVNGTTTHTGTWSVTSEDDNDGTGDVDFNINFTAPDDFTGLSDDWDVIQVSERMIKLKDAGGEGESDDYLTLEKHS
ncbi:hypothetical protein [uncultured Flavobacterium sp.]|uniref:hypothetical protein n=1 Tax=uncultured Flavobacterium sp. TaxID=165435 RepID=UPI0025F586CE|nr:hypothetical protein [uncultured Flavobacterium sp.]